MDPHESAGGIDGINAPMLAKRDRMVAKWCAEKKGASDFCPRWRLLRPIESRGSRRASSGDGAGVYGIAAFSGER